MRRTHTCLHRAERVLDRLAPLAHGLRVRVEPALHRVQQVLVLPSRDAPLRPCRALRFERTLGTCRCPVAPQNLASLLIGVSIGQPLAGRTAIDILLGDETKSCLPKRPSDFAPDVSGLGSVTVMPAS